MKSAARDGDRELGGDAGEGALPDADRETMVKTLRPGTDTLPLTIDGVPLRTSPAPHDRGGATGGCEGTFYEGNPWRTRTTTGGGSPAPANRRGTGRVARGRAAAAS
ncbi:hypothetical protein GCM10010420_19070 [Streptomyces glaucosporus]|uniref:Uncharacterized protein n=1 Tax=Streptomyces glaucosporus TaxID=284044 RepID=A0ABP5V4U9_9ACTN